MAVAKQAGVKMTHQRIEIFKEIAATADHPDVDLIYRAVQQRLPTVSLDTVYRTLWTLHDLGLVRTLGPKWSEPANAGERSPQRSGVRFDANLDPHHHYVCVRCGAVRDFECAELDALRVPEAVKQLGTIAHAQVEVRGVCTECRAQPSEPRSETNTSHATRKVPSP